MNRPVTILRNFINFSIPDLLTQARAVADGIIYVPGPPGTSPFTDVPPISLMTLNTQIDTLQTKYDAARNRDSIAVAEQDLAEKVLEQTLNVIARWAQPVVYNNKALTEQTGFEATDDESEPAGAPEQPVFTPEPLSGGAVRLTLPVNKNARAFTALFAPSSTNLDITLDGTGIHFAAGVNIGGLSIVNSAARKMTVSGLQRSTQYDVWVYGTGTAGNSPLSQKMQVTTQ